MFVKPKLGRAVRDPVRGTFLPEFGAEVPNDIFWNRRLQDGDVEKSPPEEAAQVKAVKGKNSLESE
ncbi:MAG: DUF2635 domain-containing protein [Chania sp.]